jgi:hypothetical protein
LIEEDTCEAGKISVSGRISGIENYFSLYSRKRKNFRND